MAVIKIADEPLSSSLKKKSARPSSDLKKTKSCDCNACLKRTIRVIMMCLLVTHTIWDFIETLTAMTIDFTVNHEQGRDGFTLLENLRIIEITEWEHRSWELPGEIEFHDKGNKEDAKMLATRVKLIAKCSKLKITAENNHTQCNNASKEFQEDNYFCAVIEHPIRFHDAFKPFVYLWETINLMFLASTPLIMFAFIWKSQCIRLILVRILFQLIPMGLLCNLLYELWEKYGYELCGLDYIYWGYPVRVIFTINVVIKLISRVVESFMSAWFIYTVLVEREQRGFGVRLQKNRVAPDIPVTFHDEVLQPARPVPEEEKPFQRVDRCRISINPDKKGAGGLMGYDPDKPKQRKSIMKVMESDTAINMDETLPDDE